MHKQRVATRRPVSASAPITYDRHGTRDILARYPTYTDHRQCVDAMDWSTTDWIHSLPEDTLQLLRAEIDTKLTHYAQQDVRWASRCGHLHPPPRIAWEAFWATCFQPHCVYCGRRVALLYEQRFDPQQWTLDRRNNNQFHTPDNVVMACLGCNLKRRDKAHFRPNLTVVVGETPPSELPPTTPSR